MKPEIRIALALDNYKVKDKDEYWKVSMQQVPDIEKHYELVKEEKTKGLSPKTTIFYRTYKLKGQPQ